jgi:hypothetical protein
MSAASDAILAGPNLKVKRAHRHIDELQRMTDPLDHSLYKITVSKVRRSVLHLDATDYQLTYRPKEPIPETLALIVGDAVHNLRAALDHLAAGILRRWHPKPPDRPFFPMHPERKRLVTDRHLTAIEEALPGAAELILKEIRPENGRDERLWSFNSLDNLDKHNLIIPAVSVISVNHINARIGTNVMENCGIGGDAARPINMIRSVAPIAIQNNFQTTVAVRFGQGSALENEPVIPTLMQIAQIVGEALGAFERHITLPECTPDAGRPPHQRDGPQLYGEEPRRPVGAVFG